MMNINVYDEHKFGWTVVQSFRRAKMTDGNTSNFLFSQCRVPSYGPFDTLNTKVLEKIIIGGLFMTPPQNTLQCTTVHCNVL